ncbi:MAG: DUF4369 domain-containing protein [Muribaculaceae bacterium]|nr:DUF4369 domain-containing protein [Muribaculaceae bacterium]
MKYLLRLVLACAALSMVSSCVESLNDSPYKLTCSIDKTLAPDSVSLFLLEDDYNRVYKVATVAVDSATGAYLFDGQIEKPSVAFLKFSNDSTPFYFVLEQGETQINITPRSVTVSGGDLNHEYFGFLKQRKALLAARRAVLDRYRSTVTSDSLISMSIEHKFLAQDSILADSLERITLAAINRGSISSRIILERYVNELRPEYLKKVTNSR